ncbi:BON domain-containing protein [Oxalobacteraceae bacterium]|nr:BON domain-containing protein [Oxalobacteraceae bacterium]
MSSDETIKQHVEQELKWDAEISGTDLAVSVNHKVVELRGYVHRYADKLLAERAAKRVVGVRGVANDIEVRLEPDTRLDADIVRDAVDAIAQQLPVSCQAIKVVADQGHITLEGQLEWQFQRRRAEDAVHHVRGIRGIVNRITLSPLVQPVDVKSKILSALMRSANVEAARIGVAARGGDIVLTGAVRSLNEKEEIERAAWQAPGVASVRNLLTVTEP